MLWNKKIEEEDRLPDLPFQTRQIKNNQNSQVMEASDNEEEHFESIKTSEKQNLPSFPDSPIEKGFSQSAIKEAVSSENDEKIPLPPAEEELNFLSDNLKNQKQTTVTKESLPNNTFIQPNPFLNQSLAPPQQKVEPESITKMKSENKPVKMIPVEHDYPEDAPHPPVMPRPQFQKVAKIIQPPAPEPKVEKNIEPVFQERIEEKKEEKITDVFVKIDKFYSAKKAITTIKQDVKEIENLLAKIRETKMKEERELSSWEKNISSVKDEISKVSENLFEKII